MKHNEFYKDEIDCLFKVESRKVYATLVRVLNDFELAEEALTDAFTTALEKWPTTGIPDNPVAWLVSTGRNKAVDLIRRNSRLHNLRPELFERIDEINSYNADKSNQEIEDDRLRLIFTCCHPAIDPKVQVPLTLREVCGLSTEEIAKAFLLSASTMAQRIVRGKAKIRDANIPFAIPGIPELPERMDAVLSVIYLVFNEGYSASVGDELIRVDLTNEAIRLARLLFELLPDPEVMGLLALMLLHESRRATRIDARGDIVLLEDQDRTKWDRNLISEGLQLVSQSLASRRFGAYTIQAAISAVHAEAASAAETDWNQIVALYTVLQRLDSSPVIELNRAVAIAMRDGPAAGLQIIDSILEKGELTQYHLAHSARAELLRRMDRTEHSRQAFEKAISLAKLEQERRFLQSRLDLLNRSNQ